MFLILLCQRTDKEGYVFTEPLQYIVDGKGRVLNNVMQETLSPIRARRAEWEKDIPAVYDILKAGCEKARAVGQQTLEEVKDAMKINYFSDAELIRAQQEKYNG